jgi:hypothetical protein
MGQQTPQPARAAAATTTTAAPSGHVMGLRLPLLFPTLLALAQLLRGCIYISTTRNTAHSNKYSSGRG